MTTDRLESPLGFEENDSKDLNYSVDARDAANGFDSPTLLNNPHQKEEMSFDDPMQDPLNSLAPNTYSKVFDRNGHEITLYPLNYQTHRVVVYQIISCLVIFTILGLNDQSTGSLIPVLTEHYNVSHVQVSNIFLVQTFGYATSSLMNDKLHRMFGQRGVLILGSLFLGLCTFCLSLKVKWFSLYVLFYYPIGVSIGLVDSVVNVFFGSLQIHKNELLGLVHSIYGCFSFITPIIVNRCGKEHWNRFFYIPCVLGLTGALLSIPSFRLETKEKYIYLCDEKDVVENQESDQLATTSEETNSSIFKLFKEQPVVPLYAIYLFFYLGTEVGTGSWIFTYLLEVKQGAARGMAYITASYWAGLTFGRLYFGIMTKKWFPNEYQASRFYGNVTFLFNLMFVLFGFIPQNSNFYFVLLSCCVFMAGMWIGPLFPLASVVALDVLPKRLHISGVSAAISLGSTGGAILPWIFGVIMQQIGIKAFPCLVLGTNAIFQLVWLLYPKFVKNKQNVFYDRT